MKGTLNKVLKCIGRLPVSLANCPLFDVISTFDRVSSLAQIKLRDKSTNNHYY